jgi:hypothetical protein
MQAIQHQADVSMANYNLSRWIGFLRITGLGEHWVTPPPAPSVVQDGKPKTDIEIQIGRIL